MKVIFDVEYPFAWADGGASQLCERVMQGLQRLGVEAEPLRWWDRKQGGDILQTFGTADNVTRFAATHGLKVFAYVFLDGITSQSRLGLLARKARIHTMRRLMPSIADQIGFRMAEFGSGFIVPSRTELPYLTKLYGIDSSKARVILHGVDPVYKQVKWTGGDDYLLCVGTVCRRKNILTLARIANQLKRPIRFLGRLQDNDPDYIEAFLRETDGRYVSYHPGLNDEEKIAMMQRARAFILLSNGESGCIAALESLAMGLPVILPDYTWATGVYEGYGQFVRMDSPQSMAQNVEAFYQSPMANSGFPVDSWDEVAAKYLAFYQDAAR